MIPGTMDTTDGLGPYSQLRLRDKIDVTIICAIQQVANSCIWKGASSKRVVWFHSNGGTTTLGFVTIRDGDIYVSTFYSCG